MAASSNAMAASNGKIDRLAHPGAELKHGKGAPPPRDDLEDKLLKVWKQILGLDSIGIKDNFFDIGGHSILAAKLIFAIEDATGSQIPLKELFKGPTIEYLARFLRAGMPPLWDEIAIEVQHGGDRPKFFAAVETGVNWLGYPTLVKYLDARQPIYLLQGKGEALLSRAYTLQEHQATAVEYVRAMQSIQPQGPYYLGGMCQGAMIAFEMAQQLEAAGESVALVAIMNTWPREHTRGRARFRLRYLFKRWQRQRERPLREQCRFVAQALGNRLKWLFRGRGQEHANFEEVYWPKDFVTPKINARITLLRTHKQFIFYGKDPSLGWGPRTSAGVDVRYINGPPLAIFREPWVKELAGHLAECICRATTADKPLT